MAYLQFLSRYLAIWRYKIVFQPSRVRLLTYSFNRFGRPEQCENPWPPHAFLSVSIPSQTISLNKALPTHRQIWLQAISEKSFFSFTNLKFSSVSLFIALPPIVTAKYQATLGMIFSFWDWQSMTGISFLSAFRNCFLKREQRVAMMIAWEYTLGQKQLMVCLMIIIVAQLTFGSPLVFIQPFLLTDTKRRNMLLLGITTFFINKYPLSFVSKPIFGPMSPTCIPGKGFRVETSRMGTMNACTPCFYPWTIICAKTKACVAKIPKSPGQNLAAEIEGVLRMKVSFSMLQVAVVYRFCTSEPCPSQVWAQQPMISPRMARLNHSSCCDSVPMISRHRVNMVKWIVQGSCTCVRMTQPSESQSVFSRSTRLGMTIFMESLMRSTLLLLKILKSQGKEALLQICLNFATSSGEQRRVERDSMSMVDFLRYCWRMSSIVDILMTSKQYSSIHMPIEQNRARKVIAAQPQLQPNKRICTQGKIITIHSFSDPSFSYFYQIALFSSILSISLRITLLLISAFSALYFLLRLGIRSRMDLLRSIDYFREGLQLYDPDMPRVFLLKALKYQVKLDENELAGEGSNSILFLIMLRYS